ncbi:MAG TPA: DMT family transporter [Dermatophilaceae bacterium]|nr:DMT family transporter [Dermatophilaceae bacterium]
MALTAARARTVATVLLVLLTAVWGSTFFLIRDLVTTVPSVDFLAVRFTIAAVLMVALFWRPLRALGRRDWVVSTGLGGLYGAAQILQTTGLEHTDASVSGFVTGTYVVLTPVFTALLLREHVPTTTWLAVGLATIGLAVLSLNGFAVGIGESLTLAAAALYALHIVGLGRLSTPDRATGMSAVQMLVIAGMCVVAAVPDGIVWPHDGGQWAAVIYMATAAGVLALWSQTWAQAHMSATRAAIVMTLEPVFAALFAVLFGGESLTGRMLVGGALVLAAMYTVELVGRPSEDRRPPSEVLHHEV